MTIRRLLEIGAKQYDKMNEEVQLFYDVMLLSLFCGDIEEKDLDREFTKDDLEGMKEEHKEVVLKMLNFVDKFYEYKEEQTKEKVIDNDVIECKDIAELGGKKCGNFTLEIKDNKIKVNSYFEGSEEYIDVYEIDIDDQHTPQSIVKDLKTFGFNIELEDKESEITFKDTTGKIVGIIKHKNKELVQAKLGKYKYVNLAEMFRDCDKNIDTFIENVEILFPELEINY